MVAAKTPLRCLVADDEPQIGSLLRDALAQQGYEADVVGDGESASRKIAEENYSLIVSDVMMPFKTGVELVREIRARGLETPFILMSSFLSDETLAACSKLEHLAFLQKPFSIADLKRAVSRATSSIRC
ncbi:MAG: response regulator [Planctomycetes bacterium]|nr:response regulator [Planctomycetota bacterium]